MATTLSLDQVSFPQYEPVVKHRFMLRFAGMLPSWIVRTSSLPTLKIASYKIDQLNSYVKYAGKGEWEDIQVSTVSVINPSTAQSVLEWVRLAYDFENKRSGYSDVYKKQVVLEQLSPANEIINTWTLIGAWPSDAKFGDLDYASSENQNVDFTLTYDKAVFL